MPTFITLPTTYGGMHIEPPKEPILMTFSFIRQKLDMKIHDIMYQVSQEFVDIVRHVVYNVF